MAARPGPFSALAIDERTSVVLMHTGIGMSVGLGLGERVIRCCWQALPRRRRPRHRLMA
jgi:hypothetical protein